MPTAMCIEKAKNLHRPQAEWILVKDHMQDRNQKFYDDIILRHFSNFLLCIASTESEFCSTQPQLSHTTTHWLELEVNHQ